jgi:CheY-specific phosphatase CheX
MTEHSRVPKAAGPTEAEHRAHEIFCGEVGAAIVELAHHYELDVERSAQVSVPASMDGHQVAGIIGFAGNGFGGTLAIRAPSTVVRRCLPSAVVEAGVDVLGDWIAELANQLIGRTKNKLVRFGETFQITPPTHAIADELLVLGCDPKRASWIEARTTAGPMLVMVELHCRPGFAFRSVEIPGPVAHAEGAMLLF